MATARVRLDAWDLSHKSLEAAKNDAWHPILDAYARGVQAMLEEDTTRPLPATSWLWAANTHGLPFGERKMASSWATCKHKSSLFLPWHRAYLLWFEKTIQRHIGDDSWALPYWDYTGPDDTRLRVPPEFDVEHRTVNGRLVPNPLWVENRGTIPRTRVALVKTMTERRFVHKHPLFGFGGGEIEGVGGVDTIENAPHNFVHMAVAELMASPATAGRDPVFYLHHANVDRLWENWRRLDGSIDADMQGGLPADVQQAWESEQFSFGPDSDADVFDAPDMVKLADLSYSYDRPELPDDQKAAVLRAREAVLVPAGGVMGVDEFDGEPADLWTIAGSTEEPLRVDASGTLVSVELAASQMNLVGGAATPTGLIIGLEGLGTPAEPADSYVVEVGVSEGVPFHQVGELSTFGLADPNQPSASLYVDASAATEDLTAEGWRGGDALLVRVLPQSSQEGVATSETAALDIEQITIYVRP